MGKRRRSTKTRRRRKSKSRKGGDGGTSYHVIGKAPKHSEADTDRAAVASIRAGVAANIAKYCPTYASSGKAALARLALKHLDHTVLKRLAAGSPSIADFYTQFFGASKTAFDGLFPNATASDINKAFAAAKKKAILQMQTSGNLAAAVQ